MNEICELRRKLSKAKKNLTFALFLKQNYHKASEDFEEHTSHFYGAFLEFHIHSSYEREQHEHSMKHLFRCSWLMHSFKVWIVEQNHLPWKSFAT